MCFITDTTAVTCGEDRSDSVPGSNEGRSGAFHLGCLSSPSLACSYTDCTECRVGPGPSDLKDGSTYGGSAFCIEGIDSQPDLIFEYITGSKCKGEASFCSNPLDKYWDYSRSVRSANLCGNDVDDFAALHHVRDAGPRGRLSVDTPSR
jgi:hypothetical protein